jgi:hypothetical protein
MAYNVAANLRPARPGAAFMEAQDNVMRNALAERQVGNQEAQLAAQQEAAQFQRQRLTAADQAAAAQDAAASEDNDRKELFNYFSHLSKLRQNPEVFSATAAKMLQTPLFQKYQIEQDDLTPEEIDDVLPYFAAQAGQAPAPDPVRFEEVQGPRGAVLQRDPRTGELKQVVGPDNSQPAAAPIAGQYRALSPQEIQMAGLPPGSSAQMDTRTGKIDVLSKPDATGGLSQKDLVTAKQKLNTVKIARQQLQNIKDKFANIQDSFSAGPGGGRLPTPKGRAFDAAVGQMRSTLTALTRVPGVGAMSDYETKLDQQKFPDRKEFESVTADQIMGIEQLLDGIESGYTDLISGGSTPAPQQPAAPATGGWSIQRVN